MGKNSVTSFQQLEERALAKVSAGEKVRVALVAPSNMQALFALVQAYNNKMVVPVLIGDELLVKRKAEEKGMDISAFQFLDLNEPKMALEAGSKLAEAGEIDLLLVGKYKTYDLVRQLFSKDSGFMTKEVPVHVGVFKAAAYHKLLFISDGIVQMYQDIKGKISIVNQAVKVANFCGVDCPKTAILAAVEVVYPQMQSTLDGAVLSKMAERKQIKNCLIDGPLSFDIAVDKYATEAKGITNSEVAGDADLLIAPDIATANGVYKAMSLYAKADIGGLIFGGKVPVALNLATESSDNYYNSLLLGILSVK